MGGGSDQAVQRGHDATVLPQQQVDEHGDGEEGAPHGGVAAQEEEEVAEEAEEDHPDHVELEEQVEGVKTSHHGAQVLDERRKAWRSRRRSQAKRRVHTRPQVLRRVEGHIIRRTGSLATMWFFQKS